MSSLIYHGAAESASGAAVPREAPACGVDRCGGSCVRGDLPPQPAPADGISLRASAYHLALKRSQPVGKPLHHPRADEVSARGRGARTTPLAEQLGVGGAPDVDGRLYD